MTPPRRNPYLFVVGCPRSGTTLLQRMLDAHPQLAVANDTHFVARAVETIVPRWREDRAAIDAADTALRDWSRAYHRFPRLGLDPHELELDRQRSQRVDRGVDAGAVRIAQVAQMAVEHAVFLFGRAPHAERAHQPIDRQTLGPCELRDPAGGGAAEELELP